jgi:hypothetical protein
MGLFLLWSARVLGAASTAFFLSFFAGEGLPDILRGIPPDKELLLFLPLLLVAVAGYFTAWFAPAAGGRLLILGGAAMTIYHLAHGDPEISLVYGLPFIITGALYIVHGKLKNKETPPA